MYAYEGETLVCKALVCLKGVSASVCATAGRPPLHSAPALPLNFASLKVQFVYNLAVNDLSFVCSVCAECVTIKGH